jgi:hypothetical protein
MGVVVLVAVGGALVSTSTGRHVAQPAHRTLPSWALPWPDRADPAVSATVRRNAITAWKSQTYGTDASAMYDPKQVIWYLSAPVADGTHVAVVFEVQRDDGDRRLVAGLHDATGAAADAQNWILYDVSAPDPHSATPVVVSLYATTTANDVARNWVVVLTDPALRNVFLRERHVAELALSKGFGFADVGAVRAQVRISVATKPGREIPVGVVGLTGAPDSQAPSLEPPAELVGVPAGAGEIGAGSGQGSSVDVNESVPTRVRTVIYARCYGGASITVTLDSQRTGATVPCDDRQHVIGGPTLTHQQQVYGSGGHAVEIKGSTLTAYRYAVLIR